MSLRLLAFAASLQRGSVNRKLLALAVEMARADGAEVDVAEFAEFDMPLFNADLQEASGFPVGTEELARRVRGADGMLIASPEYNFSLPGTLKNAIDWVSRPLASNPLRNKPVAVIGASTGAFGAVWSQAELRKVLSSTGARVLADELAVGHAHNRFDVEGRLLDGELRDQLGEVVATLVGEASAAPSTLAVTA